MNWLADLDDDTCFVEACQLVLDKFKIALRRSEQDRKQNNRSCHSAILRDLLPAKLSLLLISSLSAHLDQQTLSLTPSASLSLPSKAHLLDAMMVALHSAQRMFSHSSVKPHHLHTVTPILKQLWTFILRYYPLFPQHGQVSLEHNFINPFNLGGEYGQPTDTEMMNAFLDTFLFKSVDTPIWLAQKIQKTMIHTLTLADYVYYAGNYPLTQQIQSLVDLWVGEFGVSEDSERDNECLVRLWALGSCGTLMYFNERLPTLKMRRMLTDPTNPNARWFICDMIEQMFKYLSSSHSLNHHTPFFLDLAEPLWDLVNRPLPALSQKALKALLRFMMHCEKRREDDRELVERFGQNGRFDFRGDEEATRPFFNRVTEALPTLLASAFEKAKDEQKEEGREEMEFDENKLWGGVFVDLSCLVAAVSPSLVYTDAVIILLSLFKLVKSFHSTSLESRIKITYQGMYHSHNSNNPVFSSFPLALAELDELQTLSTVVDFFVESHASSVLTFDETLPNDPLRLSESFLKALPSSFAADLRLVIWFKQLPRFTTPQQLKAAWQSMMDQQKYGSFGRLFAGRLPAVIGIGFAMLKLVRPERTFRSIDQQNQLRHVWDLIHTDAELIRLVVSPSSPSQMMSLCALLAVRLMEQHPQLELWMSQSLNTQTPISLRITTQIKKLGLLPTTMEWVDTLIEEGVEDVSETHISECAISLRLGFGVNSSFQFRSSYSSRPSYPSLTSIDLRPSVDPGFTDEDECVIFGSLFD
ncbi:hypothetical protein BLNAU_16963 [Blattamonas nauphoetae]|uniref:Uncharacterized protein n=1 Tax=Blattamonas nauphoetae TaxID=2049346 RepID=A0ABQ9XA48_9EUKA|nr:hypothetical protein BLNAU_16963 [Blattamonas nauphoetae]